MSLVVDRIARRSEGSALPATTIFVTVLTAALLLASGCSKSSAPKGPRAEAVPVITGTAERKPVPVDLKAIGTVEALNSVAVRPRVGGELKSVNFREGQDVSEGELLFTLDARSYEAALQAAQANLEREKARAATAEADARRYADLVAKDYVTKQQAEQASANAAAEKATVEALEAEVAAARLNLGYCSIRSPIAGRTGDIRVRAGNLVGPNDATPLVTVNRIRPIQVGFSVPEQRLAEVRAAAAAGPMIVLATPSGSTEAPHQGELVFVDNAVDPNTGTVLLKATFPNDDEALWPGQFVNVSLRLRTIPDAVVVPAAAVQAGQKGEFVYVVAADQTAQMRPVQLGPRLDGQVVVNRGVEANETVVVDGQLRLTPGAKVSVSTGLSPAGAPAK